MIRRIICLLYVIGYSFFHAYAGNDYAYQGNPFQKKRQSKPASDTSILNAHGAGILYFDGTYYLYGEKKTGHTWLVANQAWEDYRVPAGGINCYSSTDLTNWTFNGTVLHPTVTVPGSDIDTGSVIERPKVIYNNQSHKFIMWMHIDNNSYAYARVGVAISDKPTGPFVFIRSFRPNGQESRDMTIFKDDDSRAYLFYSSESNNTMHVAELTNDYLDVKDGFTRILVNERRESPAVFKHLNHYYLITSLCTGWSPNEANCSVADNLNGAWKQIKNPCMGKKAATTFGSQISFIQKTNNGYTVVADIWHKTNLPNSAYLFLPLRFEKDQPVIASPYK